MTGIIGVPTGYLGVAGRSHVVFREARLFTMPLSAGRSLTVSAGGRSARLEPDSAGVWRLAGEASTPGVPPPDRTAFARDWMTVRADSVAAARGPAPPPGASRLDVIVEGPKGPERIVVTDPVMAGDNELWPAHLIQSDPPRPGEVFLLDAGLVRETLALLARE
jgi:hypothetical protein